MWIRTLNICALEWVSWRVLDVVNRYQQLRISYSLGKLFFMAVKRAQRRSFFNNSQCRQWCTTTLALQSVYQMHSRVYVRQLKDITSKKRGNLLVRLDWCTCRVCITPSFSLLYPIRLHESLCLSYFADLLSIMRVTSRSSPEVQFACLVWQACAISRSYFHITVALTFENN